MLFVLRIRGLYLALATMAFAAAMDNVIFPWSAIFGFNGSVVVPKPALFGFNLGSPKAFTIFLAVVFALFSIAILALRRGPFGRVLVATKDSEAACATLGLSLTTTKLLVFTLSAAMAGLAGAFLGAASSVASGTDFEMFESLLILAVVAIGGASVCSGALAGGLALGFLPGNAEDIFIGAGTVVLAFYSDGVLPLFFARFRRWWSGLTAPTTPTTPTTPARAIPPGAGAGAWAARAGRSGGAGPEARWNQGCTEDLGEPPPGGGHPGDAARPAPGSRTRAGGRTRMGRERVAAVTEPGGASVDCHACRSRPSHPGPRHPGREPGAGGRIVQQRAVDPVLVPADDLGQAHRAEDLGQAHGADDRGRAHARPGHPTHPAPCATERARRHDRRPGRHPDRWGCEGSRAQWPDRGGAGVHPGRLLLRRQRQAQALLQQARGPTRSCW